MASRQQEKERKRSLPDDISLPEERAYRKATVYDAVAGRLSSAGFIPKQAIIASTRDTASSSNAPVAPETVLFRSKNAPTRYAEDDMYFANERELKGELPDSDLLKALHCYISDFYSRTAPDGGLSDWQSMDETALIAFGVLLEESSRDLLGQTGDLVFTEGEEVEMSPAKPAMSVSRSHAQSGSTSTGLPLRSRSMRPTKRRRGKDGAVDAD